MRHLAAAVSVVTTGRGEQRTGFTATSVTSLSREPPALLVCLTASRRYRLSCWTTAPSALTCWRATRCV
ncbi:flavin reductase [Devosia sp. CN2-171]|uniref:flavin reductase n=1 Tax=Devosia sp. CN2-171 TaxID=3400909 RepID=UPI003BF7F874